jgi:hypothetical protein
LLDEQPGVDGSLVSDAKLVCICPRWRPSSGNREYRCHSSSSWGINFCVPDHRAVVCNRRQIVKYHITRGSQQVKDMMQLKVSPWQLIESTCTRDQQDICVNSHRACHVCTLIDGGPSTSWHEGVNARHELLGAVARTSGAKAGRPCSR